MTIYLENGWFEADEGQGLRQEVLDGAMDMAGYLHRAGVESQKVSMLAVQLRSKIFLVDPELKHDFTLSDQRQEELLTYVSPILDEHPELASFIADCVEHTRDRRDLMGLYLHVVHISRMMALIDDLG